MSLEQQGNNFHILFLPYMAPGHMIPTLNMARLFATRGIKATIVTTPLNLAFFVEAIEIDKPKLGIQVDLLTVNFPYEEAGLPKGIESADSVPSPELIPNFFKAVALLQHPFENLMKQVRPDCLVADSILHWASSTAKRFQIPCLSFHGCSYFYKCIFMNIIRHQPYLKVSSDSECFTVPDLPHEIKLTRSELMDYEKREGPDWANQLVDNVIAAEKSSYGVIMNSFYELETVYAEYYEKNLGIKHWHIGPLSLYFNKETEQGAYQRGKSSSIDVSQCMKWLDGKEFSSVIYICFGSMSDLPDTQLHELARALESLEHNFILVVRKEDNKEKEMFLDGFEDRVNGQGLVIRGWAPQGLILRHQSVGVFMTHCGWNSILEGVTAGLPMVAWPRHSDQLYNQKLVTDVLKIGVPVGANTRVSRHENSKNIVCNEDIRKAITKVMDGQEAEDMRRRANGLKEMAARAINEGGSSFTAMNALIEELKSYKI